MTEAMSPPLPGYTIYDPDDPFETMAGPFWWSPRDDEVHFVLRATRQHCNTHGIVHGGLMMTMIDLAMVAAGKTAPGDRFVTITLNSEFVASGREGDLIEARSELIRRTRSMAFTRGQVLVGDQVLLNASAVLKYIGPV